MYFLVKHIRTAIIGLFPVIAFCQVTVEKQAEFGGSEWDIYTAVVYDESTGESYHLGASASPAFTGNKTAARLGADFNAWDFWLIKIDDSGNRMWDRSFGGVDWDLPHEILKYNNYIYLIGSSNSPASGNKSAPRLDTNLGSNISGGDVWVIKLDLDGNKIWDKTYGGSNGSRAFDAVITSTGTLLLAGGTSTSASGDVGDSNLFGTGNCWLVNLDTEGNIIWERTLQTDNHDSFQSIVEDGNGNFVTVSYTLSEVAGDKTVENISNTRDLWVVKFDALGNVLNQVVYGSESSDDFPKIVHHNNQYYITASSMGNATGTKDSYLMGDLDLWLLKLDADLNLVWQKSFGGSGFTGYRGTNRVKFFGDDEIVISTSTEASTFMGNWGQTISYGEHDYLIFSLKDEGDFNWALQLGGSGQDYSHDFFIDSLGQLVICGQSNSPVSGVKESEVSGAFNFNFWLAWLDTPVFTEEYHQPENSVVLYPNPAVHALHFESGSNYKNYTLFSITGEQLQSGRVTEGQNRIEVADLPSGMYIIRLEGEGVSFTKKWVKGR